MVFNKYERCAWVYENIGQVVHVRFLQVALPVPQWHGTSNLKISIITKFGRKKLGEV